MSVRNNKAKWLHMHAERRREILKKYIYTWYSSGFSASIGSARRIIYLTLWKFSAWRNKYIAICMYGMHLYNAGNNREKPRAKSHDVNGLNFCAWCIHSLGKKNFTNVQLRSTKKVFDSRPSDVTVEKRNDFKAQKIHLFKWLSSYSKFTLE